MKNNDDEIFIADEPSRMNAKFCDFTLQNKLFIKRSAHKVQAIEKWQYIVELFDEDTLITKNNPKVNSLFITGSFRTGTALVLKKIITTFIQNLTSLLILHESKPMQWW